MHIVLYLNEKYRHLLYHCLPLPRFLIMSAVTLAALWGVHKATDFPSSLTSSDSFYRAWICGLSVPGVSVGQSSPILNLDFSVKDAGYLTFLQTCQYIPQFKGKRWSIGCAQMCLTLLLCSDFMTFYVWDQLDGVLNYVISRSVVRPVHSWGSQRNPQ